jgi:hypothetical protein
VILPTKHLPTERTLLAGAGFLIDQLDARPTVSSLWEAARDHPALTTFDRFVLALDLLYTLDVAALEEGRLVRAPDAV